MKRRQFDILGISGVCKQVSLGPLKSEGNVCNRKDGQTHTTQNTEQVSLRYALRTNRKEGPM